MIALPVSAEVVNLRRPWLAVSSGVRGMKRLNLTFFMELGAALRPLSTLPSWADQEEYNAERFSDFRLQVYEARRVVSELLQENSIPLAIPASRPAAKSLLEALTSASRTTDLTRAHVWDVFWKIRPLVTLLHGELAVQSIYHIWPKRAFDTNLLIDKATALFSKEIQDWFTENETYNVEQAGKCIAFETPTAAGFHLMRAAESVIRRYYALVVGHPPATKDRNWGAYIRVIRKHGGDARILHAIEQIKDLHRNPVIHPEAQLTLAEAVSLIGITESIVGAIYSDMMQREAAEKAAQPSLALVAGGSGNTLRTLGVVPNLDEPIPF